MPVYEFACDKCKHEFEISVSIKDYDKYNKQKCPKCKSSVHTRRSYSPVGIAFGKGFFKDGYQSSKDVTRSDE
tara:strand:+ start:770 stop:988 length:219 start_codon:yes stop_codon:yes gene_type:complete